MNITPWTIYWITRLDEIRDIAGGSVVLSCGVLAIGLLATLILASDLEQWALHTIKLGAACAAVTLVCSVAVRAFLPSTKEMCAIVIIPKIAQSESLEQVGTGVVDLAKQWLEELKPKQPAK